MIKDFENKSEIRAETATINSHMFNSARRQFLILVITFPVESNYRLAVIETQKWGSREGCPWR